MKRLIVGALFGALALTACDIEFGEASRQGFAPSDTPPIDELISAPVSVDELRLALSRSDPREVTYALNEVGKAAYAPGVSEVIECAYAKCDERDDSWNAIVLENDLVRVTLLKILSKNLFKGAEQDLWSAYRRDAIEFLSSKDPQVFQIAMTILARVGRGEDTVRLEAKALAVTDDVSLNVAVASLASMSNGSGRLPEAQQAIDRIRASVDPRRREMIDSLLEQMR
ncbi:MAG: hypothetical protein AAFS02_11060 [Pseudomonadota bacterium]